MDSKFKKKLLTAIEEHRDEQDEKHGSLAQHGHTPIEWVLILKGQLAKAEADWLEGTDTSLEYIMKAIAAGAAALEQHKHFE